MPKEAPDSLRRPLLSGDEAGGYGLSGLLEGVDHEAAVATDPFLEHFKVVGDDEGPLTTFDGSDEGVIGEQKGQTLSCWQTVSCIFLARP